MKKIGYIGMLIGFIILSQNESKAQYYYTSYGYAQDWYLPTYVHHTIYDNYYGYEIAHVKRYTRHGHQRFNVLLHRNGWFVELRLDHHGHIYKTIRHKHYNPLITHHCTNHCGYHKTYYQTYYPTYHHGYSTTVFVTSTGGHQHHQKNYYTNVYVEQPKKKGHHYNSQQNANRSSQPRTIRQPHRSSSLQIEHNRPNAGGRIERASAQQVSRQNTSRGRTRATLAQRTELHTWNR